jgi:Tfp pilus assembly protein PilZ
LIAKDVAGKVTWQGPVGTAEQRKAMPVELREKLKMLEAARPPKGRGPEHQPPVQ